MDAASQIIKNSCTGIFIPTLYNSFSICANSFLVLSPVFFLTLSLFLLWTFFCFLPLSSVSNSFIRSSTLSLSFEIPYKIIVKIQKNYNYCNYHIFPFIYSLKNQELLISTPLDFTLSQHCGTTPVLSK